MPMRDPENPPEPQPPAPVPTPAPNGSGGGDIVGKESGFNYTQKWGSKRGQNGSFQLGSRPPSKADWDMMNPEERAAVGITDEDTFGKAHEAWQKRYQPGNDLFEERVKAAEAITGSGANDWEGIRQALLKAGFSEDPQEQGSLFKQLHMAMEGNAAEHGRYQWNGSNWVDVATSDLNKRGIPGMADYQGPRRYGMDAILGELPQMHDIQRFQEWLNKPGANAHDLLNYQHGNMYGTGQYQYDQFGNLIDTKTGQRVGHYFPGETRQSYGGGGGGVDLGQPTNQAIAGGGPGSAPDLGALPDWLKQIFQQLGVPIPGSPESLAPQIIPSTITPNQQSAINPQNPSAPAPAPGPVAPQPRTDTVPAPQQTSSLPAQAPAPAPQPSSMMAPTAAAQSSVSSAWGSMPGGNPAITGQPQLTAAPNPTGMQKNPMSGQPQFGATPPQPRAPRQPKMPGTPRMPSAVGGY